MKEPYKRIGAKDYNELKSHKFFEGIDVDKVFLLEPPAPLEKEPEPKEAENVESQLKASFTSYTSENGS